MTARARGAWQALPLVVLALTVQMAGGCARRPAECDVDLEALLNRVPAQGELAFTTRARAHTLIQETLAALRVEDSRFKLLRNYQQHQARCVAAKNAVHQVEEDLRTATTAVAHIKTVDAQATAGLASLDARLALGRALVDTSLLSPEAMGALKAVDVAGDQARRGLDRARAEQRASGYLLPLSAFDAAAAAVGAVQQSLQQATQQVSAEVVKRCTLKVDPALLARGSARGHAEWMVLDVPAATEGAAHRMVVLKLDRDRNSCSVLYDRPASPTTIADLDGTLLAWPIADALHTRLLVSFRRDSAWFLEGGRFSWLPHLRAAGFNKACAGHISCGVPRIGGRAIEADCDCGADSSVRLPPSEAKKTARYAWDGARVIAEP